MGQEVSKPTLAPGRINELEKSTRFDKYAVNLLFKRFCFLTGRSTNVTLKDFATQFASGAEMIIATRLWNAVLTCSGGIELDFDVFVRFLDEFGRHPAALQSLKKFAYAMYASGIAGHVTQASMSDLVNELSSSQYGKEVDKDTVQKLVRHFWEKTKKKKLKFTEFEKNASREPETFEPLVSVFGVVDQFLRHAIPPSLMLLLEDPKRRDRVSLKGTLGNRMYRVQDSVLYEYKKSLDTAPQRAIPLVDVDLVRVGDRKFLIHAADVKNMKLEASSEIEMFKWVDTLLLNSTSSLHIACERGDLKTVSHLLQDEPNVVARRLNAVDSAGRSCLHVAMRPPQSSGPKADKAEGLSVAQLEICRRLVTAFTRNREANINILDNVLRNSVLHEACQVDDELLMMLLKVKDINVNVRNSDGNTPLHYFCMYYKNATNFDDVLSMFIQKGADKNAQNNYGEGPIHKASMNSSLKILMVRALVKHGALVNLQTAKKDTVLNWGILSNRFDLVKELLSLGASMTIEDARGMLPYDLAKESSQPELADFLERSSEVVAWLKDISMEQYAPNFIKEEMFTPLLNEMVTTEDVFESIGIKSSAHKRKLLEKCLMMQRQKKNSEAEEKKLKDAEDEAGALLGTNRSTGNSSGSSIASTSRTSLGHNLLSFMPGVQPNLSDKALLRGPSAKIKPPRKLESLGQEAEIRISRLKAQLLEGMDPSVDIPFMGEDEVELTGVLGSGTAGDVFKGLYNPRDKSKTSSTVAVKVLKNRSAEKELQEFKREFKILSKISSPYLVEFYAVVIGKKQLMLVMEYCDRGSMYHVLSNENIDISWYQGLQWALEAAKGVVALHTQEPVIVHRDLKTLNLLVTADWQVKLCDFGLSRSNSASNLQTLAQLRGTMAYCAPEAYLGERFGEDSDVYSLGVIYWEMFMRVIKRRYQRPFSEYPHLVMDFQIIIQVAKSALRPTIPKEMPQECASFIAKCWQQDRTQRLSSKDVLNDLLIMLRQYHEDPMPFDSCVISEEEFLASAEPEEEDSSSSSSSSSSESSSDSQEEQDPKEQVDEQKQKQEQEIGSDANTNEERTQQQPDETVRRRASLERQKTEESIQLSKNSSKSELSARSSKEEKSLRSSKPSSRKHKRVTKGKSHREKSSLGQSLNKSSKKKKKKPTSGDDAASPASSSVTKRENYEPIPKELLEGKS